MMSTLAMDEVDAVRRRRPKDSFQNELHAKLKQRKSLGLSAEITDSEEDVIASPRNMDFMKSRAARPSSAKRRPDQSPNLSHGLGTTTMRARDLSTLLARDDDDEDEEIVQANLGKYGSSGRLPSPGMKTPSPKMDSGYMRKTPTLGGSPKDQTGRLDSLYGRKTPTKDTSPKTTPMSKEDIIFGRKTPVDERKSPSESSSKTRLPGMDSDRPWQPPNFRSASPGLSEHSRGSRGVTPVDATLDTISETPREKYGGKSLYGQKTDISPRQLSLGDRPKPQARSRLNESKTPPLMDPRRKSPSSPSEGASTLKRSTPTLDLFGGRARDQAAMEVEGYIEKDKKTEPGRRLGEGRKTPDGKLPYARDQAAEGRGQFQGKDRASPTGRFTRDGRKTPTTDLNRKTPTGKKTPTELQKSQSQDPRAKGYVEPEGQPRQARSGSTLLDFLMESGSPADKPKPQERKMKQGKAEEDGLDALLAANRQALRTKSPEKNKSLDGRKSPIPKERRAPTRPKSPSAIPQEGQRVQLVAKEQRPEDTSSLCEEIPPDPNRKVAREAQKQANSGKQRTERAQADSIIDTIADAQGMQYIQPAKKMRPVTAEAKVQHRPKPRYGVLPGQEKPMEERQFNSTTDIRDAIYEEWYNERLKSARKKKMEEERKKRLKEEEENKKKQEKRSESEASYQAWLKAKKERALEAKEKEEIERKKKEEEEEEKNNNKDTGSYEAWKKNKMKQTMREKREKSVKEQAKKEEEEWKRKQKEEERKSSHQAWVAKKKREQHNEAMKKKDQVKSKKEIEEEEKELIERKKREAMDQYYEWMEKKESQKNKEKRLSKQRSMIEEDNPKPAWYPSNRTIPFGR